MIASTYNSKDSDPVRCTVYEYLFLVLVNLLWHNIHVDLVIYYRFLTVRDSMDRFEYT